MYSRFRFPIWAPDYVCATVELKPELECIAKTARNAKNVWCRQKKLLGTEFCASQIFQVCFIHQVYRTSTVCLCYSLDDVSWLLQLDPELQVLMSGLLPLTLSLSGLHFIFFWYFLAVTPSNVFFFNEKIHRVPFYFGMKIQM